MRDTTVLSPSSYDPTCNNANTNSNPSLEAVFIHFMLAIKSSHCVGVQISVVPFCLHEFRGQVFYFAEGSFSRCCDGIHENDVLAPTNDAAEAIHQNFVPWHKWNVRAPGFWRELAPAFPRQAGLNACTEAINRYMKQLISETQILECGTDTRKSSDILLVDPNNMQEIITTTNSLSPHTMSRVSSGTSLESGTSASERPLKKKRKLSPSSSAEPVLETADELLWRLGSVSISDAEVSSYIALTNVDNPPLTPCGENVSRAWEMCLSFARRSNQKMKYGRFLRFLSLCFFLIWERYSDKQGKSAAREVNAKMREAGFSGHSRGLKTMRDETTLINRLIASIQESCKLQEVGVLYHIIFEASNYQLIRTINRLGRDKKQTILEYMCDNMNIDSLSACPTAPICIQTIIQQYLPNLSLDFISSAIGYEPIRRRKSGAQEGGLGPQQRASMFAAGTGLVGQEEVERLASPAEMVDHHDSPSIGFRDHIFSNRESDSVSGALDMLNGMEDFFFPSAADMDIMNSDFSFNHIDMGSDMLV
ncbi:hypothetical protein IAQ61_002220 [Plenodomus lingam]|nr:hypothetical protein IAQ61_002220 [Plenodomus lingam]